MTSTTETPDRSAARGTPCARSWRDEWVAEAEAVESRLDRRAQGQP